MTPSHKYDVALSFASEQRDYVSSVHDYLEKLGITNYYDEADENSWGKNLVDHFSDVFKNQAKFCVMFISKEYDAKTWTNFERQVVESRELIDNEYILPVRFDETAIQGLNSSKKYLEANKLSPEELAELTARHVKDPASHPNLEPPKITYRQPILRPQKFNTYREREKWINYVLDEIGSRVVDDRVDITILRSGILGVRILIDGKVIYALNFKLGGMASDDGLSLSQSENNTGLSNNSVSAYGSFDWDREKDGAVFVMQDLSVFTSFGSSSEQRLTSQEFTEHLWNKIVDLVEQKSI